MSETLRSSGLYTDADTIIRASQKHDDKVNECILNNDIIFVVTQDKDDPTKFTIRSDYCYNEEMEGIKLTFADPEDFKRLFPELNKPVNVHLPPNTEQNQQTGLPQGKQDPNIPIEEIVPTYKNNRLFIKLEKEYDIGSIWFNVIENMNGIGIYVKNDEGKYSLINMEKNDITNEDKTFSVFNVNRKTDSIMVQCPSKEVMDNFKQVVVSRVSIVN